MLKGGNPLTVGVGIIIEVIRKNNSDYDPDVGGDANSIPTTRDPIYLGTLLRMFAERVPDFMELILSPNHTIGGGDGPVTIKRKELAAAFGSKVEPLGFDRFKTCELMAELLHCSNMGLLNEIGSEEFVKARDLEREKLKKEGKLGMSSSQLNASDEDLTMKSSTQTRLSPPQASRKLEVQNASDDDGFEEVTHSADVSEDSKDDFDGKPGEDVDPSSDKPMPLFLDKDDDEFVDEPLSSPRLNHVDLDQPRPLEPELMVQPLSPSKDLSKKVDSLGLEEDTRAASSQLAPESQTSSNVTPTSSVPGFAPPESQETSQSLPLTDSAIPEQTETQDVELLPHPEDKPAPLFARKNSTEESSDPQPPETSASSETVDTTMGEAGDSSNSVLMSNTENQEQSAAETASAPVVGDFLKMQFVEHKVVPTILVSNTSPLFPSL
jgi:SIT4-associating protein SAP185/190